MNTCRDFKDCRPELQYEWTPPDNSGSFKLVEADLFFCDKMRARDLSDHELGSFENRRSPFDGIITVSYIIPGPTGVTVIQDWHLQWVYGNRQQFLNAE